jgi:hypothetical protein
LIFHLNVTFLLSNEKWEKGKKEWVNELVQTMQVVMHQTKNSFVILFFSGLDWLVLFVRVCVCVVCECVCVWQMVWSQHDHWMRWLKIHTSDSVICYRACREKKRSEIDLKKRFHLNTYCKGLVHKYGLIKSPLNFGTKVNLTGLTHSPFKLIFRRHSNNTSHFLANYNPLPTFWWLYHVLLTPGV